MSDPQHASAPAHPANHPAVVAVHEEHPHVNYMLVFYALLGFTVVSWAADEIAQAMHVAPGTRAKLFIGLIVLVVATFKALAVMMYFMHLKFERAWKYALLAPTLILAMALIVSLMPDMTGDYYPRVIPQTAAAAAGRAVGGDAHAGGHAAAPAPPGEPGIPPATSPKH